MSNFSCAAFSRQSGEDIIGSGTNCQTYVLVECPTPWANNALETESLPENLKSLIAEVKQNQLSVKFLLINNNETRKKDSRKILIYDQKNKGIIKGYSRKEFNVENIGQAAELIRQYFTDNTVSLDCDDIVTRDILVCTHGNHDLCCGKYGAPFYTKALATISELSLRNIRIWRASHFGGHRFAPTAIDFPDGRYYGGLDQDSFKSILTRTGDISCMNKVYRGWGIIPTQIQVLERELMLLHGWNWFDYKVAGKILKQSSDKTSIVAELTLQQPNGSVYTYQANLVKDESKTISLKGSCHAMKESEFIKYYVESLRLYLNPVTDLRRYRKKVAS
ncbi:MAG: sucrase ferredoxin [Symploca sp. SIO1C4]|uniref:Sucrase ferredoxin n=1 Tax=Symploca sp. SIO1C4 TaxID=2607765 RepID=A0A6B3NFT7_9CYAN|nr:sucrase ferredoxin [Symploca sp. SIO1C4]